MNLSEIKENIEFTEQDEQDIIDASYTFAIEQKALDYLNRREHSFTGLLLKLKNKGYSEANIIKALNYLQNKNYLSDSRFARSFLNTRKISHSEGKSKLLALLLSKGVSRQVANSAIENFFEENDEFELCKKAYKKCKKLKKSEEKILTYLLKSGFSIKLIKEVRDYYEEKK